MYVCVSDACVYAYIRIVCVCTLKTATLVQIHIHTFLQQIYHMHLGIHASMHACELCMQGLCVDIHTSMHACMHMHGVCVYIHAYHARMCVFTNRKALMWDDTSFCIQSEQTVHHMPGLDARCICPV